MEKERRFNQWAGNPKGDKENTDNCIESVMNWDGWHSHQCRRKRGYGKEKLYCKQHADKIKKREMVNND